MIELVITFLVLAMIAGFLGFSGVEVMSIEIARICFYIFLVLFAISLLYRLLGGRRPPM